MNICKTIRQLSTCGRLGKDLSPVFKPHYSNSQDIKTFDKNLPKTNDNLKPWELANMDKDKFFKRKYGNISPEHRKRLDDKVDRQRRLREMKKIHEREKNQKNKLSNTHSNDSYGGNFGEFGTRRSPLFDYVYGTHSVKSVLLNNKRLSYNTLYVYNGDKEVIKLAKQKFGIKVVEKKSKNDLNMLTNNGVHNGLVLETKPLVLPSIYNLGKVDEYQYEVITYNDLNNSHDTVKKAIVKENNKFPLGLFLDGLTDPQNMGNVIRSAYYLGVDFIVVPQNNSARLGPVTNKASVGSLDAIDIYENNDNLKFIERIKKNGWVVVSTGTQSSEDDLALLKSNHAKILKHKYIETSDLSSLLSKAPLMLVMGSEGTGLRTNMKLRSDYLVGINKGRNNDDLVDSLNVGVAAGILIDAALS